MASYKVHTSFGAIAGVILAVLVLLYFTLSTNEILFYIFAAAVIGSFLPDLDSDSGIPFQVVFGLFGLLVSGLVLYGVMQLYPGSIVLIIMSTLAAFVITRFGIGWIFKKFTRHRGIFHSIPAAGIAMFTTLIILNQMDLEFSDKIYISVSIGLGYIVHLVLDEVYATVNLNGKIFRPNKALGSALKLWSRSWLVSIAAYILLLITAYKGLMVL